MLHRVRETDAGIVVRGARMLSTLAPFANALWVGPFYPRRPGEEDYALCFAMPMGTPGLRFLGREPYDLGRGSFDRLLSSASTTKTRSPSLTTSSCLGSASSSLAT